jgi:hypothetical protein
MGILIANFFENCHQEFDRARFSVTHQVARKSEVTSDTNLSASICAHPPRLLNFLSFIRVARILSGS